MKINNILESINKAIDVMRFNEGIEANGHFVAMSSIKKSMGPYKAYHIIIDYVDLDGHKNFTFCNNTCMERCPTGEEHKLEEQCTLEVLTRFFIKWNKFKDAIIKGEYDSE